MLADVLMPNHTIKYELLSFDRPVFAFSITESTDARHPAIFRLLDAGDRALFPLGLQNLSDRELETAIRNWLDSRITMLGRRLAARIRNLPNPAPWNPLRLVAVTHGLSLNDVFWMRENGEHLSWADVNLYSRPFSRELEGVLLTGKAVDEMEGLSPDFTLDGRMRKSWMRDSRGTFLVKSDRRCGILSQSMCEWFAAQAAAVFGISHVTYDLRPVGKNGYPASECPMFTTEDTGFVKASQVFSFKGFKRDALTLHTLGDVRLHEAMADAFGRKAYEDMMAFDFLIGNIDRHLGNYGWLVDNHSGDPVGIAPLFDHGKAFFADEPAVPEDVEDWIRTEAQISTFLQPEEQLEFIRERHEEGILRLQEWEPRQHPAFPISDAELEALRTFTRCQCAQALEALSTPTPRP